MKSIQQFAQLKNEDRRSILRFLTDEQYMDVMKIVGRMPLIDFQVRSEGEYSFEFCACGYAYMIFSQIFSNICLSFLL